MEDTTKNNGACQHETLVMRTLHLTLKKEWFNMIKSGVKKEEYREIKPYWTKRFIKENFDKVQFKNGYSKDSPTMTFELKEINRGFGIVEWGAPMGESVYILCLGKRLDA